MVSTEVGQRNAKVQRTGNIYRKAVKRKTNATYINTIVAFVGYVPLLAEWKHVKS